PAPAPVCAVLEPTCEGKDYVRRDSCGKELGRWVNAPVPYCPREGTTVPVAPTPAPAPVCAILEPTCEGKDYVRRDSCGKELGRWVNAPVPYCPDSSAAPVCTVLEPKCEGKDSVRRDSCGKELGRWVNAPVPYCPREGATVPVAPTPAPAPAPAPAPVCTVLEPKCEGKDSVRRDSCGKELGRWLNAPVPYCPDSSAAPVCTVLEPKCEGRDSVRRDSCGKELGRWVNAPVPYCPKH
ncbi:MAG: hypothetical protein H7061_05210, partial [Bdellovibrionaceae bacterium]|nr:hypothetical protein [Bdellovibrio sp.]